MLILLGSLRSNIEDAAVNFGLLAIVVSLFSIIVDFCEEKGDQGGTATSRALIAGLLVSIPSLTSSSFRNLIRAVTQAPAAKIGVGLSAQELCLFLVGSSVFAVLCFSPTDNSIELLHSIENASTICTIIPLLMYL